MRNVINLEPVRCDVLILVMTSIKQVVLDIMIPIYKIYIILNILFTFRLLSTFGLCNAVAKDSSHSIVKIAVRLATSCQGSLRWSNGSHTRFGDLSIAFYRFDVSVSILLYGKSEFIQTLHINAFLHSTGSGAIASFCVSLSATFHLATVHLE